MKDLNTRYIKQFLIKHRRYSQTTAVVITKLKILLVDLSKKYKSVLSEIAALRYTV